MSKNEVLSFDGFVSIMAVAFKLLNLLHVSSCEMVTFCDILHEAKQETKTNPRECAVRTGNQL